MASLGAQEAAIGQHAAEWFEDMELPPDFPSYDGDEVICTNGYVKKQQTLDQGELARARRYQQDWMGQKQP